MHVIRSGSAKPPLLVTHGLQCDVTFAAMLARELPSDRPVYAFQAPGLAGREEPLTTIDAMAQRYCAEAREVIEAGRVNLVGFCAGGHIALQMARLLGTGVGHVFLVDAPRAMPPGVFDQLADEQVTIAAQRVIRRPELARFYGGGAATVRAYTDALNRQEPRAYGGETTMIATTEAREMICDPAIGWPDLLPPSTPLKIVATTRAELLKTRLPAIAAIIENVCNQQAAIPHMQQ